MTCSRFSFAVAEPTFVQVNIIAGMEKRTAADVCRLLLQLGLREYFDRRSLECEYARSGKPCTRAGCCGGRREQGRLLRMVPPPKVDAG